MSLAQHVSSTEGADREWIEPLIDEEFPLGRVLSYDPLPPVQVEDIADHVAAYKVRKRIRYGKQFLSMSQGQSNLQLLFSFRMIPGSFYNLNYSSKLRSGHRRLAKQ
jgi:hypothetical protein